MSPETIPNQFPSAAVPALEGEIVVGFRCDSGACVGRAVVAATGEFAIVDVIEGEPTGCIVVGDKNVWNGLMAEIKSGRWDRSRNEAVNN